MSHLSYSTHGNPANPAVLLLHGFMSCAAQWTANIDALSQDYYLVNVELWGHGSSAEPATLEDYSIEGYVREFERIRHLLDVQKWFVVGQSYGAGVVMNYTLAQPQQCLGIVATNSRSAFGTLNDSAADRNQNRTNPFDNPDLHPRDLPYHPIHARRFPEAIKAELVRCADAMTIRAIQHGGRVGQILNFRQRLDEISHPLLLTNGVYEKAFQQDLSELRARYPDLAVVDLPGGHSVNIEAADEFNRACLEFFATVIKDQSL